MLEKLESIEGTLATHGQQLSTLEAQVTTQGQQLATQGQQLTTQGQQLATQGQQLVKLEGQVDKLNAQVEKQMTQLGKHGVQLASLESKLASSSHSPSGGSSGSSSPKGLQATLLAALRNAVSVSQEQLHKIASGDARALLPALPHLMAHRMRTDMRVTDFVFTPLSDTVSLVSPSADRGLSLFVVASDNAAVVTAAHRMRGLACKGHAGCLARPISSLPGDFMLTINHPMDCMLDGRPITLHATLAPMQDMLFPEQFREAFSTWGGGIVCHMVAGAGEAREDSSSDEGLDLSTLSSATLRYAANKLAAEQQPPLPAGGSSDMLPESLVF